MISKTILTAITAASGLLLGSANAAYVTGFGDNPGDEVFVVTAGAPPENQALAGQNGWYTNDPNAKVSFLADVSGNTVGAVGGTYFNATNVTTYVGHDYFGGLVDSDFKVDFNITQSSVAFPGVDSFGWALADSSGLNILFAVTFTVDGVDPTKYNVGWSTGGAVTPTTTTFFASTDVRLTLKFDASGADATFLASLQGLDLNGDPIVGSSAAFTDTLTGAANSEIGSFNAVWTKTGGVGDNFMSFDNISVPEPTGLALAGVALGGMMLRRRRA